jgi:hypothetical protein
MGNVVALLDVDAASATGIQIYNSREYHTGIIFISSCSPIGLSSRQLFAILECCGRQEYYCLHHYPTLLCVVKQKIIGKCKERANLKSDVYLKVINNSAHLRLRVE